MIDGGGGETPPMYIYRKSNFSTKPTLPGGVSHGAKLCWSCPFKWWKGVTVAD